MRLGVPVVEANGMSSEVNGHFGMSDQFALLDMDGDAVAGLEFVSSRPGERGHGSSAATMADNGVNVVLAGGIGPHMIKELLDSGLRVYRGAVGDLNQVIEDYRAGMLDEVRTPGEIAD